MQRDRPNTTDMASWNQTSERQETYVIEDARSDQEFRCKESDK